eukprot:SAG11_NODE_679_length_7786_cov_6.173670_8_plen_198_part_00
MHSIILFLYTSWQGSMNADLEQGLLKTPTINTIAESSRQHREEDHDDDDEPENSGSWECTDHTHFIFECLVKLNLEVFGAGGAVWGFSDCTNLRNKGNNEIWRWVALGTGVVFLLRWLWYIFEHVHHKRLYIYTHKRTTAHIAKKHTHQMVKLRAAAHFAKALKAVSAIQQAGGGNLVQSESRPAPSPSHPSSGLRM